MSLSLDLFVPTLKICDTTLDTYTNYIIIMVLVFRGYRALTFITHSRLLLFPVAPLFVLYIASLLGFNVSRSVLTNYFGG